MDSISPAIRHYLERLLSDLAGLDSQIVYLMMIIVVSVIVLDAISLGLRKKRQAIGLQAKTQTVSIDGSKSVPVRNYVSELQGLAGKPDALISENGFLIPIERKPLARKIHDRYVAQLLVYMRLIEEFEGKKPPYGYLILGPSCRRIRIDNTPERQRWLQGIVDEMMAILAREKTAVAAPHPRKCVKCDVQNSCNFRFKREEQVAGEIVQISRKTG